MPDNIPEESEKKELYGILGLDPENRHTLTVEDIRKAYIKQARKKHPDKNTSIDKTNEFQTLSNAYGVLSVPLKRKEYDQALDQKRPPLNSSEIPPTRKEYPTQHQTTSTPPNPKNNTNTTSKSTNTPAGGAWVFENAKKNGRVCYRAGDNSYRGLDSMINRPSPSKDDGKNRDQLIQQLINMNKKERLSAIDSISKTIDHFDNRKVREYFDKEFKPMINKKLAEITHYKDASFSANSSKAAQTEILLNYKRQLDALKEEKITPEDIMKLKFNTLTELKNHIDLFSWLLNTTTKSMEAVDKLTQEFPSNTGPKN